MSLDRVSQVRPSSVIVQGPAGVLVDQPEVLRLLRHHWAVLRQRTVRPSDANNCRLTSFSRSPITDSSASRQAPTVIEPPASARTRRIGSWNAASGVLGPTYDPAIELLATGPSAVAVACRLAGLVAEGVGHRLRCARANEIRTPVGQQAGDVLIERPELLHPLGIPVHLVEAFARLLPGSPL